MPLGWYIHDAMTEQHGDDWAHDVCIEWHDKEEEGLGWEDELVSQVTSLNENKQPFLKS